METCGSSKIKAAQEKALARARSNHRPDGAEQTNWANKAGRNRSPANLDRKRSCPEAAPSILAIPRSFPPQQSVRPFTISPFIPANSWLGCSHRGMLNVSLLGFHFFFSFELPYLKASKKANRATDLNVTNQSEQNHLMSASSLCRM